MSDDIPATEIPGGTEMTAEDKAFYFAQGEYIQNKETVINVITPWVVAINNVSLAEEVAEAILKALDLDYRVSKQ